MTYYYSVIDVSQGSPNFGCSKGDTVTVNAALVVFISPQAPTIVSGQSTTLTAFPSHGTHPYSYQWYSGATCDSLISGQTSSTYSTGALSLTSTYSVFVTDNSTGVPAAGYCTYVTVTVYLGLTAPIVSANPKAIDIGRSSTLNTTTALSGGTSPYTCQWLEESPAGTISDLGGSFTSGCTASSEPSASTGALTVAGVWKFELQVKDAANASSVSSPATVTVNPVLVKPVISASPGIISKGHSSVLTTKVSFAGGTSPYICQWLKKSPTAAGFTTLGSSFMIGCTTSSKPTVSTGTLTTLGTWSFELEVMDGAGAALDSYPATVAVLNPAATTLVVSCGPASAVVGSATICVATVTGFGYAPVGSIAWSSSQSGKFSSTACKLSGATCSVKYTPESANSPSIITARYGGDSKHSPSVGVHSLTVTKVDPKTKVQCTPASVRAGSSQINCRATMNGYMPTGTVSWSQGGIGSVSFVARSCPLLGDSCSETMTGFSSGTVTIVATYSGDSNNQGSSSSATLTVTPLSCGDNITANVILSQNIGPCTGDGLFIGHSGITLNCAGYTISGIGNSAGIALIGRTKVTVEGCNVKGFQNGFWLTGSSNKNVIMGDTANDNYNGFFLNSSSDSNVLAANTANSNKLFGFYLLSSSYNTLKGNTASKGNLEAFLISKSSGNILTGNVADNNYLGYYFFSSSRNTITGNMANNNTYDGFNFDANSNSNTLADNTANSNAVNGFEFDQPSSNALTGNTADSNNIGFFFFASSKDTLARNTANGNVYAGFLLEASTHNTITGNTANNNHNYGFSLDFFSSNNILTKNTANSNTHYGYFDSSIGYGTLGSANTYILDECSGNGIQGSSPVGLGTPQP
jgi:parallel beta-helix repeat protein